RIAGDARVLRDLRLPGNFDALTARREFEAVIAAAHIVALDDAHGERQVAVAAAVFERDGFALLGAVEHDRQAKEYPRQRGARDLFAPGGDVPAMAQEHGTRPPAAFPNIAMLS